MNGHQFYFYAAEPCEPQTDPVVNVYAGTRDYPELRKLVTLIPHAGDFGTKEIADAIVQYMANEQSPVSPND